MEQLETCLSCHSSQLTSVQQTQAMMHPSEEVFNFDQCENCGLVFLNPRVPQMELGKYYTDFYLPYRGDAAWGKYEKWVASSQKKVDQKRTKMVSTYANIHAQSTILDVGCGKPTFLQLLYEKYGCVCIGTDFSDEGWKNNSDKFSNLELLIGDLHDLTIPARPDVVTMWHYLEHDYDPAKTLQKIKTIARPNTKLVIEVPNFDSTSRKKYGAHWSGFHTPRHTVLFTPATIKILLEKNGWEVEQSFTYGSLDPYILYWMSEQEKKNLDWSKSMESEFVGFVKGMIQFFPKAWLQRKKSLGFMTVVARPK
ncbi:MAG: class I SAM-dependent methyltransferase [Bacteroidota bacterium]